MTRRVFVVAAEYSANPRSLTMERRSRGWLSEPHPDLSADEVHRVFFRFPNRSEDGRTSLEDWRRDFGLDSPIGLTDLFASAAHRALTSVHRVIGGDYEWTREAITHLYLTSMPGLDPNERMNIGLVPQALRSLLRLSRRVVAQYVVGTSDSGAWALAQAVRAARSIDQPVTMLIVAGQIIPAGYTSQYQIRSVLGEDDQGRGIDMLAVGDLLMDSFRRSLGLSRGDVESFLAAVARRKFEASAFYPSGIYAGKQFERKAPRTPYFDASDIAAPCCGAAATIITSDETLISRISASRSPRYRTIPITEVLGVGEGSSSENVLHRSSPLIFGTAIREALADTADHAGLPLETFASSAFGVVHDAFPSIELAFLLAMGMSWERSAERMREGWSNPFGGLLTFGHALGASGLVQVNKVHHLFCLDQRHIQEISKPRKGFQPAGAIAFTTSVGGPLSHIVAGLFRGGFSEVPPAAKRGPGNKVPRGSSLTGEWRLKRHQLRRVVGSYLSRLTAHVLGEPWFLEGITYVSVRSALRALSAEDVARLTFDGLEQVIAPEHLAKVRGELRETIHVVTAEAERAASMFDAFRMLTDEVRALVNNWRSQGFLNGRGAAMTDAKLADRVKEYLRVPVAVLYGSSTDRSQRRRLLFLPEFDLTYDGLENVDVLSRTRNGREQLKPASVNSSLLPFWVRRATRAPASPPRRRSGSSHQIIDQVLGERDTMETAEELQLLRSWFSPDASQAIPKRLVPAQGSDLQSAEPPVSAVLYLGEISERGPCTEAGEAEGLLARAAREAMAFTEPYETTLTQMGSVLALAAFQRPPLKVDLQECTIQVARFAREVAQIALENGVVVHGAIYGGDGALFVDAAGQANLGSPVHALARKLLETCLQTIQGPALATGALRPPVTDRMQRRLFGWTFQEDKETGCMIWRMKP